MSNDSWRTPDDLFNVLDKGGKFQNVEFEPFNFDIDLCATAENSKCDAYYEDYLTAKYIDWDCAFMNPPYSNPRPFIEKAYSDSKYCKIVCLVKADPSTKWWATFWNYNHETFCRENRTHFDQMHLSCPKCKGTCRYVYSEPKPGCEIRFFPKRIQFDPPIELVNSGEVWKVKGKWVQKCSKMVCIVGCIECGGKGYKTLSGPTFSSALIIMDRRNV